MPTTIIRWNATDEAGNIGFGLQDVTIDIDTFGFALLGGFLRTQDSGLTVEPELQVTRVQGGMARFMINDYRGNLDSQLQETVLLNVFTSAFPNGTAIDATGIESITLVEAGLNTGNFTAQRSTLLRLATLNDNFVAILPATEADAEQDHIFSLDGGVLTATYDSPDIASLIFEGRDIPQRSLVIQRSELPGGVPSDDILTAIVIVDTQGGEFGSGAPADNNDPVKWAQYSMIQGEVGTITVFDETAPSLAACVPKKIFFFSIHSSFVKPESWSSGKVITSSYR